MINKKLVYKIFEAFSIQRWTDMVRPFDLVEMDKAGEKMVLAYMIGKAEENKGNFVDWTWMIYASFFDLLRKISLCDIKAPVQDMLQREYPDEYRNLNEWVLSQYEEILNDDELFDMFKTYIDVKTGLEKISEKSKLAERVLSAAHKYASMRELSMLSVVNEPMRTEKIRRELQAELQPYLDLTGLQLLINEQRSFEFIMKIEQLRFQVRWNQTPRVPKTTVLGHCFFVAIVTLLLCRSENNSKMCESRVINNYFCALFHDLPEAVTRDIISPVKTATHELPNIVKKIEDEIVRKELLPLMEPCFSDELMYFTSDEFSNRIIDSSGNAKIVTYEDLNEKYNDEKFFPVDGRLVRVSDHLSALMEADSSIRHGITSRHLEEGRSGMLSHYNENELINGICVARLFSEIVG